MYNGPIPHVIITNTAIITAVLIMVLNHYFSNSIRQVVLYANNTLCDNLSALCLTSYFS